MRLAQDQKKWRTVEEIYTQQWKTVDGDDEVRIKRVVRPAFKICKTWSCDHRSARPHANYVSNTKI